MSKYTSNRQRNLKIGISSYTDNQTVLEVTGKVGIGKTNALYDVDVAGDINFDGELKIFKKKSIKRKNYRNFFDKDSQKLITDIFWKDFEIFDYSF